MKIDTIKDKYNSLSAPIKASLWFTVSNVIQKGISFLSTPIFTRILSTTEYGIYAQYQAWYGIIVVFATFQLYIGGFQRGLLKYKDSRDSFISSLLILCNVITLFFFIIFNLNPTYWSKVLNLPVLLIYIMFLELFLMPAFEFWMEKEKFDYSYKKVVVVSILMSVFSILLGVFGVLIYSNTSSMRIFSDVLVKSIICLVLYLGILKKGKCLFNLEFWKFALIFNIPLIPHFLSTFVLNQADRIMIGKLIGDSEAAIYSIAYTISTMMILVINAINSSFVPYVYKSIEKGNLNGIRKHSNNLLIIVAVICFVPLLLAPELIYIVGGDSYYEAIYVVPPITVSVFFIFVYSLFSNFEYFYQKSTFISIASILCAVLNIGLNFIFIKEFGYIAAGYTTLICYMFLSITHFCFYYKIIKNECKVNSIIDIRLILFLSFFLLIFSFLIIFLYNSYCRYIFLAVILLLIYKKRVLILNVLKNKEG